MKLLIAKRLDLFYAGVILTTFGFSYLMAMIFFKGFYSCSYRRVESDNLLTTDVDRGTPNDDGNYR